MVLTFVGDSTTTSELAISAPLKINRRKKAVSAALDAVFLPLPINGGREFVKTYLSVVPQRIKKIIIFPAI